MLNSPLSNRTFYFSHGRTALKYGLLSLNFKTGNELLIPDFICSVVLDPLSQLGIKVKYYPINAELEPVWEELDLLVDENTKGILMVHFFGRPQNILKFENFCAKNSLLLIEDNAHGHGGKFEGKLLGTFGDIGFSSPRKGFNICSGGILFWNRKDLILPEIPELPEYPVNFHENVYRYVSKFIPKIKPFLKIVFKSRPGFEDPFAFQEARINDYCMDSISKTDFLNIDLDKVQNERQKAYFAWASFAEKNNLLPVFKSLNNEGIPQCFPAYVKNEEIAERWFDWGWKHRHHVYSWPSLPLEIINQNKNAFNRWKHLVCFSTSSYPKTKNRV